jgi:hypothetical protein
MPLDPTEIAKLYAKKEKPKAVARVAAKATSTHFETLPMPGFVRSLDPTKKTTRCCSRGCMTSAHWTVRGIPYCEIHTVRTLGYMLAELAGEEVQSNAPGYPSPIDVMELLDILFDVLQDTQEAYDYIERIEKVMTETGYPNLRRQYDVFNELRRQRESVGSSNTT